MARPISLEAISKEPRPDMPWTGLPIELALSLDQRSPQRLSVTSEPSTTCEHLGHRLDARRDPAVVLAHAEHVVALVAALLHAALDLAGLPAAPRRSWT